MGGTGGMPGADAGMDCAIVGCDDGNQCTVDGVCNTLTGVCQDGGSNEPIDTSCNQQGGFFCDGDGRCVVCNSDAQCERFFPPQECREPTACVENDCVIPPVPDGTPCSIGQCFQGRCLSTKLVPMVCGSPVTPFMWQVEMDMTVVPSAIEATRPFTADILAALELPQEFLQFAVAAVFPQELTSIEVRSAAAEIVTAGVLNGSPVSTILSRVPVVFEIAQEPNPGDAGGTPCEGNLDCPLSPFFQTCGPGGQCDCACRPGCEPEVCANIVTEDIAVPTDPIFKAGYTAAESGDACFDVGGLNPPGLVGAAPARTGIRAVASNGAVIQFECVGGTLNDGGTPDDPRDDTVDPNPPEEQLCFPIQTPDVDLCDGAEPVDCSSAAECVADGVCEPFTGTCLPGVDEPRGTPCSEGGGRACDGRGTCVACVESSQCPDDGNQCTAPPSCVADACVPQANLTAGALCDQNGGDRCDGEGNCVEAGSGPFTKTGDLTLGCTSSLPESGVSIIPFELTVVSEGPLAGEPFTAELGGTGLLPESLLDAAQWAIPGGVTRVNLVDLRATVHARAGVFGVDVVLEPEPIPYRCALDSAAVCDPANDLDGVPGKRGNTDCTMPMGPTNPCGRFIEIPISYDCGAGGTCESLGKLDQCGAPPGGNGFCVTGPLSVPLQSGVGNYVASAMSSEALFGWDDASTGATVGSNGTWMLPPAVFADPIVSNGIRADIGGLSVAFECTMGVDGGGIYGVGVPEQSSPTPNLLLISFEID